MPKNEKKTENLSRKLLKKVGIFDNNNFIISLTKKPEELEEVVVTRIASVKLSKDKAYEKGKINELVMNKATNTPKKQSCL